MKFTVLTPTYNRAHTLTRLYESLKKQTIKDFEWLVIDDGSQDNTENLIKGFIEEKPFFNIVYKKQENGGKHRAINYGLPFAKGELTFFLDSDDWLLENALETIVEEEKKLDRINNKICAIEGLKLFPNNKNIGSTFDDESILASYIERKKYNISGDKAEVYYTDIIKKYPFPEIEGEKFLTERLVWQKPALDGYKIWWFNKPIQYCEYIEDGLTVQENLLYAKNPKQWGLAIKQDYNCKATNLYNTTIQVYIYYIYTKQNLKIKDMAKNLEFSKFKVRLFINLQRFMDCFRFVLHKKHTVKKACLKVINSKK